MLTIKNFIEKVSYLEGKGGSVDFRMPMNDARILRDDLAKMLADYYSLINKDKGNEVIKVEITGGKF